MADSEVARLVESLALEWTSTFSVSKVLPPPRGGTAPTVSLATRLLGIDALPVPRFLYDRASHAPVGLRLRVTLLDSSVTALFGNQWESDEIDLRLARRTEPAAGHAELETEQVPCSLEFDPSLEVLFRTSQSLADVRMVVEIVASLGGRSAGTGEQTEIAWAAVPLLANDTPWDDAPLCSTPLAPGSARLSLFSSAASAQRSVGGALRHATRLSPELEPVLALLLAEHQLVGEVATSPRPRTHPLPPPLLAAVPCAPPPPAGPLGSAGPLGRLPKLRSLSAARLEGCSAQARPRQRRRSRCGSRACGSTGLAAAPRSWRRRPGVLPASPPRPRASRWSSAPTTGSARCAPSACRSSSAPRARGKPPAPWALPSTRSQVPLRPKPRPRPGRRHDPARRAGGAVDAHVAILFEVSASVRLAHSGAAREASAPRRAPGRFPQPRVRGAHAHRRAQVCVGWAPVVPAQRLVGGGWQLLLGEASVPLRTSPPPPAHDGSGRGGAPAVWLPGSAQRAAPTLTAALALDEAAVLPPGVARSDFGRAAAAAHAGLVAPHAPRKGPFAARGTGTEPPLSGGGGDAARPRRAGDTAPPSLVARRALEVRAGPAATAPTCEPWRGGSAEFAKRSEVLDKRWPAPPPAAASAEADADADVGGAVAAREAAALGAWAADEARAPVASVALRAPLALARGVRELPLALDELVRAADGAQPWAGAVRVPPGVPDASTARASAELRASDVWLEALAVSGLAQRVARVLVQFRFGASTPATSPPLRVHRAAADAGAGAPARLILDPEEAAMAPGKRWVTGGARARFAVVVPHGLPAGRRWQPPPPLPPVLTGHASSLLPY